MITLHNLRPRPAVGVREARRKGGSTDDFAPHRAGVAGRPIREATDLVAGIMGLEPAGPHCIRRLCLDDPAGELALALDLAQALKCNAGRHRMWRGGPDPDAAATTDAKAPVDGAARDRRRPSEHARTEGIGFVLAPPRPGGARLALAHDAARAP